MRRGSVPRRVEQLLKQGRHEEALDYLEALRSDDPVVRRCIHKLREKLIRTYLYEIGDLGRPVAVLSWDTALWEPLPPEVHELLRRSDGRRTVGELAAESELGQFMTFRILSRLVRDGLIAGAAEASALPVENQRPRIPRAAIIGGGAAVALAMVAAIGWSAPGEPAPVPEIVEELPAAPEPATGRMSAPGGAVAVTELEGGPRSLGPAVLRSEDELLACHAREASRLGHASLRVLLDVAPDGRITGAALSAVAGAGRLHACVREVLLGVRAEGTGARAQATFTLELGR